jgi:lysophospholipase L1-like esterase
VLPGAILLVRKGQAVLVWICLASMVASLLFVSSFAGWHGGSTTGPRYLLSSLPFYFILLSGVLSASRNLRGGFFIVGAFSAFQMFAIAAVSSSLPGVLSNPLGRVYRHFFSGQLEIRDLPVRNFENLTNKDWAMTTFNLGEKIGLAEGASLVPALIVVALFSLWLWRLTRVSSPRSLSSRAMAGVFPRISVSAGVVVLLFLAFESYLRLTFETHEPAEISCDIYSETLLWSKRPNCGGTNRRGYRDRNYTLAKDDGVFRIVIVGDSVVAGERIDSLERLFGKILERRLNRNAEGRSFETIHLARSGYTTQQELTLLRDEAFEYHPDLVLWNYVLNDPLNPVYHPITLNDPRYGFQSKWSQPTSHVVAFVKQRLFFVMERWKGRDCPDEYHEFIHCAYRDEVEANFRRIGSLSRENHTPIIFVINPIYHRKAFRYYNLTHLHKRLARMAMAEGLVVYDILDAYKGHRANEVGFCLRGRCDIWHPNEKGHEVIAEFLDTRLKENGYLKAAVEAGESRIH